MAYVYTFLLISVLGFTIYRIIKNKSLPSNRYTPYDDITMGKPIDINRNLQIQETKHVIEYEELDKDDKIKKDEFI
jgi:hypothetical protein